MYPCLTQVRRKVQDLTKTLFREVPDLRMAVVAHGDYCDGKNAITTLDFSTKPTDVCKFVQTVKSTSGGDAPECYEAVLRHARCAAGSELPASQ